MFSFVLSAPNVCLRVRGSELHLDLTSVTRRSRVGFSHYRTEVTYRENRDRRQPFMLQVLSGPTGNPLLSHHLPVCTTSSKLEFNICVDIHNTLMTFVSPLENLYLSCIPSSSGAVCTDTLHHQNVLLLSLFIRSLSTPGWAHTIMALLKNTGTRCLDALVTGLLIKLFGTPPAPPAQSHTAGMWKLN